MHFLKYCSANILVALLILLSQNSFAQNQNDIDGIVSSINGINEKLPKEFLHFHIDKPSYTIGDTLWFKAYLLKETDLDFAESGILYLEVVNDDGVVVKRMKLPVKTGLSWGQVPLVLDEFEPGFHTLRSYSKYQLNFDKEQIYTYPFYIGAPKRSKVEVAKLQTVVKKNLNDKNSGQSNALTQVSNIDMQFLPEGGNLVAGLQNNVIVKALGSNGKSVKVSGSIYNSAGEEVALFVTNELGVGVFSLEPQLNDVYTAKMNLGNELAGDFKLPKVHAEGTSIMMINRKGHDKIDVYIQGTKNKVGKYYLVAKSRGVVGYAAIVELDDRLLSKLTIPKENFSTGIVQISLLDANKQPLNERMCFVEHDEQLKINITSQKKSYSQKDSVSLEISVTNKDNQPVEASLSMAVTDDGQVKIDSNGRTILSDFLLASQLSGEVENPSYYLSGTDAAWADLDLLLLSQGWTGYRWNELPDINKELEYPLEKDLEVKGKVVNGVGKPQEGRDVTLMSNRPAIVKKSITDKDGRFSFDDFPPMETISFMVQSTNKKGKRFNVGVEVDEFEFPVFDIEKKKDQLNDGLASVSFDINLANSNNTNDTSYSAFDEGVLLKPVEILGKKIVKGSRNLNGEGNSDQALNEKDMLLANNTTLLDLLQDKIKGFRFDPDWLCFKINNRAVKFIFDGVDYNALGSGQLTSDPVEAIVEMSDKGGNQRIFQYSEDLGQIVSRGYANANTNIRQELRAFLDQTLNFRQDNYFEVEGVLKSYKANDLKGIEVLYNDNYNGKYNTIHTEFPDLPMAYIEITTRAGTGARKKSGPGVYYYRPMPFSWPKDFYQPRYRSKVVQDVKDRRPTLLWEPTIITDETGKAQVSFYTSDMPGTYSINVEGADMKGLIGGSLQEITVE